MDVGDVAECESGGMYPLRAIDWLVEWIRATNLVENVGPAFAEGVRGNLYTTGLAPRVESFATGTFTYTFADTPHPRKGLRMVPWHRNGETLTPTFLLFLLIFLSTRCP